MDSDQDLPLFQAANAPPTPRERTPAQEVITVSALNQRVRGLLEARLELLWVAGEISNAMRATSGHWYFSLKDENAQVRCVLFKQRAGALPFTPANGLQVEVCARPSLYEARGEFQLGVETMRRAGLGALFEAFEKLKAKLAAAGLFEADRKKPLPFFPRTIGIVTSLQAAALRDVLSTLKRRAPMVGVIIYPTAVQGAGAAAEIAAAIDRARERHEVETLLICRGGGSMEDLWSFNEEIVARAIARLQDGTNIAVVSGVGHETDFTICDFVADRRAATPTAAAELASPDRAQLLAQVGERRQALQSGMQRWLQNSEQRLDRAARSLWSPEERIARERERLAALRARLSGSLRSRQAESLHRLALSRQTLEARRPNLPNLAESLQRRDRTLRDLTARMFFDHSSRLAALRQSLAHLSPSQVLARGYGIVEHRGRIVRDSGSVKAGDEIAIRLSQGSIDASVKSTKP
ncbi:MAG: exodeoxyribonuclease VII large subunit [Betaproteobacteria bacterium]|nr:exodeoxyribonuclease VII large subunit [Betaproteobacteria bacterium]